MRSYGLFHCIGLCCAANSFPYSPDVVTVVLPGIMPSRSAMHKTDFLSAPLEAKLFEYDRMYQLPKFRYGEVIFTHIYNKAMSVRRIQDYDNMETKKILDWMVT